VDGDLEEIVDAGIDVDTDVDTDKPSLPMFVLGTKQSQLEGSKRKKMPTTSKCAVAVSARLFVRSNDGIGGSTTGTWSRLFLGSLCVILNCRSLRILGCFFVVFD